MNATQPLAETLKFNHFVLDLSLTDMTDDLARRQLRGDAGPSIAWNLGHLLNNRATIAGLASCDGPLLDVARFGQSGASDGRDYPTVRQFQEAWHELSSRLMPAIAGLSPADLSRPSPLPLPHDEKTLLDALYFFTWHESFHLGQVSLLRSHLGLTPAATLARARRAQTVDQ